MFRVTHLVMTQLHPGGWAPQPGRNSEKNLSTGFSSRAGFVGEEGPVLVPRVNRCHGTAVRRGRGQQLPSEVLAKSPHQKQWQGSVGKAMVPVSRVQPTCPTATCKDKSLCSDSQQSRELEVNDDEPRREPVGKLSCDRNVPALILGTARTENPSWRASEGLYLLPQEPGASTVLWDCA